MLRAPFSKILPLFGTVAIERGLPGYATEHLIPGEHRLSSTETKSILIASTFLGVEAYAIEQGFDQERFIPILKHSVRSVPNLTPVEQQRCLDLVHAFETFRIIRTEHAFDDWICEAWWDQYQTIPYSDPSAMSGPIAHGINIIISLERCTLEYDQAV